MCLLMAGEGIAILASFILASFILASFILASFILASDILKLLDSCGVHVLQM